MRNVTWCFVLAASIPAQSIVVAPPSGTTDAISRGRIAGVYARERQQLIVSESLLAAAKGKTLVAAWVRRDRAFGRALPSSRLPSKSFVRTTDALVRYTVPGGTLPINSYGQPDTPGFMMLGAIALRPPIDLGFMRAPGCKMHVRPVVTVSSIFSLALPRHTLASTRVDLQLPANPAMLRATFYVQWANWETRGTKSNPIGLSTSNGLEIELAGSLPGNRIANVQSEAVPANHPFPATGRVEAGRGPVLRFEFR